MHNIAASETFVIILVSHYRKSVIVESEHRLHRGQHAFRSTFSRWVVSKNSNLAIMVDSLIIPSSSTPPTTSPASP